MSEGVDSTWRSSLWNEVIHMSSFKGGYIGDYIGDHLSGILRGILGV